jgi:uncharacterized protein YfaS (alpha-2-macroglobulin family)
MGSLVGQTPKSAAAVSQAFGVLQSRQNDTGGFGLWTSSPDTAEFPTVYASHFLVEAKDRGQKIPAPMLTATDEWLSRFASTPASTLPDARSRAYAVYLLARQGVRNPSALSNVEQELSHRYPQAWPTDLSAAWLAATYRLMQRNADADRIIAQVPWSRLKRDFGDEIYYDSAVHDAQLLYILAHHFPARLASVPPTVLEDLASAASHGRIDSLSAAWTLLALDSYSKAATATGKATAQVNSANVQFTNSGSLPAYYAISESGFDRNLPAAAASQGIEVFHEFLDLRGNIIIRVKVGEEFLVRVRMRSTNRARVPQIAIVDLLPGGTEPVLNFAVPDKSNWTPQHVDRREDRLVLYGDIGKDTATFVYKVNATNAGIFQAPPAFVESLYDPKTTGFSVAGKLEIVKP